MGDHPAQRSRRRSWTWLAPAFTCVAAFSVYLAYAWRPALSTDESATALVVRGSWESAWTSAMRDIGLAPYYLVLKPWSGASTSPLWLRLPSVLAAAVAVTVVFVFVRRVVDPRTACATAAVLVILPVMTREGQNARPYAFALLAGVVAVVCWWDYVDRGRFRAAAGMTGALVVLGLSHAYGLLMVGVLLVTAALAPLHDRRRDAIRTAVPAAIAVTALVPYLWLVADHAHGSPRPPTATPTNAVRTFVNLPMAGGSGVTPFVGALIAVLAVVGLSRGWLTGGSTRTLAVLSMTWWVLPPAALVVLQALTDKPGLVPRYWTVVVPAIAIGVGLAVRLASRAHVMVGVVALLALAVLTIPAHRAVRSVDGHGGARYLDLLQIMALPALESAPVLVPSWPWGLVANDPAGAPGRFPLVLGDPHGGSVDLLRPPRVGVGSDEFRTLVRDAPMVIVIQERPRRTPGPPVPTRMFDRFRTPLRVFDAPMVTCRVGEYIVGVFSQGAAELSAVERRDLAARMAAVHPERISCAPR